MSGAAFTEERKEAKKQGRKRKIYPNEFRVHRKQER